jgi:hypothetical protein
MTKPASGTISGGLLSLRGILLGGLLSFLLSHYLESQWSSVVAVHTLSSFLKLMAISLFTSGIVGYYADVSSRNAITAYFDKSLDGAWSKYGAYQELGLIGIYKNRWDSMEVQKSIVKDARDLYLVGTSLTSFVGSGVLEAMKARLKFGGVNVRCFLPGSGNPCVAARKVLEDIQEEDAGIGDRVENIKMQIENVTGSGCVNVLTNDILPHYYFLIANEKELLVAPYGFGVGGKFPVLHLKNIGNGSLYEIYLSDIRVLGKTIERSLAENQEEPMRKSPEQKM